MKTDPGVASQLHSTAHFLLEALVKTGIEYLFCNFGTDHAPIIEELARRRKRGDALPKIVRCPHENTAAHMAAGYAFATGRGQGVLVHVDVGTANVTAAMHNLFRSRLPVLLIAGKAPFTSSGELVGTKDTYVHFVQEPFDQGSLVRPYVKWEWTLPSGVVVNEAIRRAHTLMQSDPKGPVYLMIPREILTERWSDGNVREYSADRFGGVPSSGADPDLVAELASRLLAAERPILITSYGGRDPRTSRLIGQIAEFAGIAVFEANWVNNIPHDSRCFLGARPGPHLENADFGLLVDVDVPWFPADVRLNESTFWAQIDVDVLKAASPMWTFPGNLRLQGNSARILEQLLARLQAQADARFKSAAGRRLEALAAEHEHWLERVAALAADHGRLEAINPHYLFAELGKVLDENDLIFNEAVCNTAALGMQVKRPLPGTMMRVSGGGLGASGAMALGAKLACPRQLTISVVGDGSFYFNNPCSVLSVSRQYDLPILMIVLDNGGWSAVRESTLRVFPDGEAAAQNSFEAQLAGGVEFAKVGEAFGAHGEKVSDPAAVPSAIARCVDEVRGGRSAVLHVRIKPL